MTHIRPALTITLVCVMLALAATAGTTEARDEALSVAQVLALLQQGTSSDLLVARIQKENATFDLAIEDVVRLRAAGATAALIQLMARGEMPAEQVTGRPMAEVPEPPADALTVKRVIRMYHRAVPPEAIAAQIAAKGLAESPELEELIALRAEGVPEVIIRALALGRAEAPALAEASPAEPLAATGSPMAPAEVIRMLESKRPAPAIVAEIARRGMESAPTLDEAVALRRAGATDEMLAAIDAASPETPELAAEPEPYEEPPSAGEREAALVPPAPGEDRLLVTSVPSGARVFVAPSRTRLTEAFRHDFLAGRTPLRLSLPPGDYRVIVQKQAGAFEGSLVPAWRTLHDTSATRTLLDNADLTFDPEACCLPGSLSGMVQVHSVPSDLPQAILGDQFDGLPPYLFDGESTQILQVRKGRIAHVLKVYEVRKNAGQPRMLVSSFVPAEGDPLDESAAAGLPQGSPFDPYVDAEAVEFLTRPDDMAALASTLGVPSDRLAEAVTMLRRAGKAILHQEVEGGVRLLALALDDEGGLRLTEQTVRPVDPFAPPAPVKSRKKRKAAAPPPPPPLPEASREVVPGLGLPRLAIENDAGKALGLLLANGQFCFVPARTHREFVVDPGTFDARVLGGLQPATPPRGTLHFSYHARYTLVF